jgi:cytochrome c
MKRRIIIGALSLFMVLSVFAGILIYNRMIRNSQWKAAREMTGGGDPARGKQFIERYGCGTCHIIPGVRMAKAMVGPSLEHIGSRTYIAGVLANTPENMAKWIVDPPDIDHKTAMPNLHVTENEARHIVGYLYTLR